MNFLLEWRANNWPASLGSSRSSLSWKTMKSSRWNSWGMSNSTPISSTLEERWIFIYFLYPNFLVFIVNIIIVGTFVVKLIWSSHWSCYNWTHGWLFSWTLWSQKYPKIFTSRISNQQVLYLVHLNIKHNLVLWQRHWLIIKH